jgi:hypothetical protein
MKVGMRIRCGDTIHTAEIRPDGTMVLPDHPSLDMMRAFTAFGAAPAGCLQRLETWQTDPALLLTAGDIEFIVGDEIGPVPIDALVMISHDWAKHVLGIGTKAFPFFHSSLDLVAHVYQHRPSLTDYAILDVLGERVRSAHKLAGTLTRGSDSSIASTVRWAADAARRWMDTDPEFSRFLPQGALSDIRYFVINVSSSAAQAAEMTYAVSSLISDAPSRGLKERQWQGKHAAKVLHRLAEGKPWQPL